MKVHTMNAHGNEIARVDAESPLRLREMTRETNTGLGGVSFETDKMLKMFEKAKDEIMKLK